MKKNPVKVAIVAIATAALGLGILSSAQSATTLWISSDLPKQGGSADQSASTNKAIRLLLKQQGNKAGNSTSNSVSMTTQQLLKVHGMTHSVQRMLKHTLHHVTKLQLWVHTTPVAQKSSFQF